MPPLFTLTPVIDLRIKVVGVEALINSINEFLKPGLKITTNNVKESLIVIYSLYKKNIHLCHAPQPALCGSWAHDSW